LETTSADDAVGISADAEDAGWSCSLRAGEALAEFGGDSLNVRFVHDAFVRAGNKSNGNLAAGKFSPAIRRIERTEEGMEARPKYRHVALIGLGVIGNGGAHVGVPQAPAVLGICGEVDLIFSRDIGGPVQF